MLRELLTTWENWSARNTLTRALDRVTTDESRARLHEAIADTPEVAPLDALRDVTELITLLSGWRWSTIYAARRDGATWEQVAETMRTTVERARADYAETLDRQESVGADVTAYREVL